MQFALNVLLFEPLSRAAWTPSDAWRTRMDEITSQSRYWLVDAISFGATDLKRRGWEGEGDWNENVWLGFMVVKRLLESA